MENIKKNLYNQCLDYVNQRIETAEKAIKSARESANDDTKSSAGDKYETGRAMMQQEIDNNQLQLNEAKKLKVVLDQINPEKECDTVQIGSLVITNKGNFFISVSAGQLKVDGAIYFAVSSISPIGTKLMRLQVGSELNFNGKEFKLIEIH
ncbi:MAG: transcription elongation factor [Sphingobacteriales bacterium]|nr:transcription elongation factor [Sphingobacteriales bacterium]